MHVPLDYERLYRDAIFSVVSVYVGREAPGGGAGSGFVYDADASADVNADTDTDDPPEGDDGYVVTNEHVVRGASEVELRFSDGQWRTGAVAGRDAYTDLAVVRVPDPPAGATPLPVAAETPDPGRPVAALGNPMGLDGSISAGIVSGVNRSLPTSNRFAIPDVVQTDAPINPGNSGGPLVALADGADADATADATADADDAPAYEVVGVNRARQGDNIGFAVSPAIVNRVVPALVAEGRYRHSYLRTRTVDVTPAVAEANGLDAARGVLVVDVADGPTGGDTLRGCDRTELVRGRHVPVGGDVVVGIGGRELRTHEGLMRYLITETRPGEPVEIDVVRDGRPVTLRVELGERPDTGDDGGGRALSVE